MKWRSLAASSVAVLAVLGAFPSTADPVAQVNEWRLTNNGIIADVAVAGLTTGSIEPTVSVSIAGQRLASSALVKKSSATESSTPQSIVFAVDVSGSMANGNLYEAKLAALQFVDELPTDVSIGVVAFGDTARVAAPLTLDRAAVRSAISRLRPSGNTALYDGLQQALGLLGGTGRRSLILLTDGKDTTSVAKRKAVTRNAGVSGVRVDAIRLGSSRDSTGFLNEIVAAGMGQLFAATDAETLLSTFRRTMQMQTVELQVVVSELPKGLTGRQPISIELQFGSERTVVVDTIDLSVNDQTDESITLPPVILLALSCILAASIFTLLLALLAGSKRARRRRVEQVIAIRNAMLGLDPDAGAEDRTLIESLEELVRPWIRRAGVDQKWTLMLDGAGLMLTAEQWLLIRIGAVFTPMLLVAALFPAALTTIVLAGLVGFFAPPMFVKQRRKSRSANFESALPDMLLLIASSLRSGFSLEQAINTAADQSDGPAAQQMKRAMQEVRIGLPLDVALGRVAERMASKDFHWVVAALRIQRKSGGNLSELLSTAAKTVRERAEIRREVLTLTAEGRLSANVMMLMPFGLLGFMLFTQPGYVEPLWTTELGRLFSMASAIMLVIGWFSMRKLVQVDA